MQGTNFYQNKIKVNWKVPDLKMLNIAQSYKSIQISDSSENIQKNNNTF